MRQQDGQSVPFSDYLDAKYPLDERSVNEQARVLLLGKLRGRERLSCLDVGSGTGSMVRRLLRLSDVPELLITVLDSDRELLEIAQRRIAGELQQMRLAVKQNRPGLLGESVGRSVLVDFTCCRVSEFTPPALRYDLITAHSFMDLVALDPTLRRFEQWLAPGGLLYCTQNYDGGTYLFPAFEDQDFEARLLSAYDTSMERRRVDGEATGGARAGSRLIEGLWKQRWNLLTYGTSDWNLTPVAGRYQDRDKVCVQAMLDFIRLEGERSSAVDSEALRRWGETRQRQLAEGVLGLIVHQLDVLAAKSRSERL